MGKEQINIGLEIGTSKICVVVAETRPDGPIRILGVGEAPSRGVRKGEIVDFSTASKCVHEALSDAEEKSDVEIRSVWTAVTGSHISSFNNRGAVSLPEDKDEITEQDLLDVEHNAKDVTLPSTNAILHTIIQHYFVDGQPGVLDPVGMMGHQLEADFHIIHGVLTRVQNTIRCIKEARIEVEDVVISGIASAQVVATPQQKELGVAILDIGGGVTDYIVYVDGAVRHSGVLAVGGDHITNDISIGLRLPITRAERLKVEEGSVDLNLGPPGETIILKNDASFSGCEVERAVLNRIIHARIRELLELIRRKIESQCSLGMLGSGVIITGGCSLLNGIQSLAEEVFELPVSMARAHAVSGPTSAFANPQYSTAIGLVRYAQAVQAETPAPSLLAKLGGFFKGGFK